MPRRLFAVMRMAARNPRDRPMNSSDPQLLVSTDWLAAHLSAPDLRILDASWHMPAAGRDARAEFEAAHIPGARFFDIDEIADEQSSLPHMAPPVEKFVSRMRAMGIGDGHRVVVYDTLGHVQRAAGLVDLPALRQDRRGGARRRAAEVARRGPPARDPASRCCATATSPPAATPGWCATSPRSPPPPSSATPRSSTPAPPTASAARRPSRGRACAPATSRARRTCRTPSLVNPDGTMKDVDELRAIFEAAGVDLGKPGDHHLRLRHLRGDPGAGARAARQPRLVGLRRRRGPSGAPIPDLKVERG